jgi:hypothetical protein
MARAFFPTKMKANKTSPKRGAESTRLKSFEPPPPTLLVPFEPHVIRELEIRAATIGQDINPACLVNSIVKAGMEAMTAQDLWWPSSSPKIARFRIS